MKKSLKQEGKGESEFDYKGFEEVAIGRINKGASLLGADGVLTAMIQRIVNAALEGEVKAHLADCRDQGEANRRNGHLSKGLNTEVGPVEISSPRDRLGTFTPQIVPKWERSLSGGLSTQILSMYSNGTSIGDIRQQLVRIYGVDYSAGAITAITDEVMPEVVKWQQRPLMCFYVLIYLDAIHYKTRESGTSKTQAIYTIYGIDADGQRDILGLYVGEEEGARHWGLLLEDLKRRGVEDVLFFCIDGLTGFADVISRVFPKAQVQRCIVHMIRTSAQFVADKDIKELCADLRKIYTASDVLQAGLALESFKVKWDKKYPAISKKWEENWGELTHFMEYGPEIRKLIYTTNAVEALHRQMRKVTKTKGSWVNEKALIKQLYLTLIYNEKGWTRKVAGWKVIQLELVDKFEGRYKQWATG